MKTITKPKDKNADNIMVFAAYGPVSLGHQAHTSGTGIQADRRTRRNRTRSAQRRTAIREY